MRFFRSRLAKDPVGLNRQGAAGVLWVSNQRLPVQGSGTNVKSRQTLRLRCARMRGLTPNLLLRMGLQPLPAKRAEAAPLVLSMNRRSYPHRSPVWELRGVSIQSSPGGHFSE